MEDGAFDAEPAGNAQSDIENIDFDNMYPADVDFDSFGDEVNDIESAINDADSSNVENDVHDADVAATEETPEVSTRKIVERIYNQVIDALKERDLDKRLALNI